MFVRIMRGRGDDFYECDRIRIRPRVVHDKVSETEIVIHCEQNDGKCVSVIVNKKVPEALGVYALNNRGTTIQTIFRKREDTAA